MKKIMLLLLLLLFITVICVEQPVNATPLDEIEYTELTYLVELADEKIAIYHSQEPTIYYIYELSNDDNCVIATRTKIIIGGNKNAIYRIGF